MNVSLPTELEKFVADTVATGRYSSASEVVRTALRILEEERWKAEMRQNVSKGLEEAATGRIVDGETAMKRIRAAAKSKGSAAVPILIVAGYHGSRDIESLLPRRLGVL